MSMTFRGMLRAVRVPCAMPSAGAAPAARGGSRAKPMRAPNVVRCTAAQRRAPCAPGACTADLHIPPYVHTLQNISSLP